MKAAGAGPTDGSQKPNDPNSIVGSGKSSRPAGGRDGINWVPSDRFKLSTEIPEGNIIFAVPKKGRLHEKVMEIIV